RKASFHASSLSSPSFSSPFSSNTVSGILLPFLHPPNSFSLSQYRVVFCSLSTFASYHRLDFISHSNLPDFLPDFLNSILQHLESLLLDLSAAFLFFQCLQFFFHFSQFISFFFLFPFRFFSTNL